MLVRLSSFFRDPESYEVLAREAFPRLLTERGAAAPLRVWVPGCSTGEEAYSIAMLIREHLAASEQPPPVQLLATDSSAEALAIARRALYPATIGSEVGPERLERFFLARGTDLEVAPEVRELCSFSTHGIESDPPPPDLDIIWCRDVLTGLAPPAQREMLTVFHGALRPGGYLVLGRDVTLAGHGASYRSISLELGIAERRDGSAGDDAPGGRSIIASPEAEDHHDDRETVNGGSSASTEELARTSAARQQDSDDLEHPEQWRALRRSESMFRAAFDNAAVGIALVDSSGRYLRVNQRLCEITGYDPDELGRRSLQGITHPDDAQREAEHVRAMMRGEEERYATEQRCLRPDGSTVWVHLTASLQRDEAGAPDYLITVVEDISAREAGQERLRQSDQRRDEFLAALAHEIRNPLAAISSGLHVLPRASGPDQLRWTTSMLDRQVGQLTHLVDDLLDISRINRGKIDLQKEPLEVREVIQRALGSVCELIKARRHRVEVSVSPEDLRVEADAARLEQLLVNLLTNAARYTDDCGQIDVRAEQQDGSIAISVSDSGIGIPAEALQTIFEMFVRGEHAPDERMGGGLGIGLTLVKRIAELHSGSVTARSGGVGRGSTFTIRLPALRGGVAEQRDNRPRAGEDAPDEARAAPPAGRQILVIDDNRDLATSFALVLEAAGHRVQVAHSGAEGLACAAENAPDVVLLDIGLPDISGHEVARRMRQQPALQRTLIITISGYGQDRDQDLSMAAGCDLHLVKPVDAHTLLEAIDTRRQAQAQA